MKSGTRGKWCKELALAKLLNALANNGERIVVAASSVSEMNLGLFKIDRKFIN